MADMLVVYGTLRYGGSANRLMLGARYVGTDAIYGSLYDLGSFPGLKLGGSDLVVADVYELPDDSEAFLSTTDRYEGYNPQDPRQCLYKRLKTQTVVHHRSTWVYEYCHPVHEELRIIGGDWFHPMKIGDRREAK